MSSQRTEYPGLRPTAQQLIRTLGVELAERMASGRLCTDFDRVRAPPLTFLPPDIVLTPRSSQLPVAELVLWSCAVPTIHVLMNTIAGIDRLPPEVLALIPAYLPSPRELISVTHVCRRWRNVFVASPSLWTALNNKEMHHDALAAYLARCGGAEIDLTFCTNRDKNLAFLQLVAPRSIQIRSMKIPSIPWSHISEISDFFSLPLPLLRQVEVSAKREESIPTFSRPLLSGASGLHSIVFFDASWIPRTLPHFSHPSLTHAQLSFIETRTHMVAELLEFLSGSPLLESVHVAVGPTYGMPIDGSTLPDIHRVSLNSLRTFRLEWLSTSSPHALLSRISYPPNCSVSLRTESESDVPRPPQGVFLETWADFSLAPEVSEVALRMGLAEKTTECSISLVKTNGTSLSVSHIQDLGAYCMWSEDKGGMDATIPSRDQEDYHTLLGATAFIRKLHLRGIRKFVVEGLDPDEKTTPMVSQSQVPFTALLASMQGLTTLSLKNTCASPFLKILRPSTSLLPPPTHLCPPGPFTAPPCPSLEVLELRHPRWERDLHAQEVIDMAEARTRGGVPLRRLLLCSGHVPDGFINTLSAWVEEIEFWTECRCV